MYSRDIDGRELTFAASGWTYRRQFVLYDVETESLWYHLPGRSEMTCIAGEFEGRSVPQLASSFVPWGDWRDAHPDTKSLPLR